MSAFPRCSRALCPDPSSALLLLLGGCTALRRGPFDASPEVFCAADACASAEASAPPEASSDAAASGLDLRGWWRAEGNANDELGRLHAVVYQREPGYVPGRNGGQAFAFRNEGGYAVARSELLDLPTWTVMAWVRIPPGADQGLFHSVLAVEVRTGSPQFDRNLWFGIEARAYCTPGTFSAQFSSNGVIPRALLGPGRCVSTVLESNAWHHLAASYDGTTLAYYLDGRSDGTLTVSAPCDLGPSHVLSLGFTAASQFSWLDVDELKLFSGALSPAQIEVEAR